MHPAAPHPRTLAPLDCRSAGEAWVAGQPTRNRWVRTDRGSTPPPAATSRSTVRAVTLLAALDLLLTLGLTLRVVRAVTGDTIGERYILDPTRAWAMRQHPKTTGDLTVIDGEAHSRRWLFWQSGLACPFCIGFYIAGAVLLSLFLVGGPGDAAEPWRWVAGWFTLNWIAAHVGSRLGDAGYDEDED